MNYEFAKVGLKPNKSYSDEELLNYLIEFYERNGKIPSKNDFSGNPSYPNFSTYQERFGSWNNAKIAVGFEIDDEYTRGRIGEIQTLSEFKTDGAVDLSGENTASTCDGMCPKGELYDVKSASISLKYGKAGWLFNISICQLESADYLFLRAYSDKEFTKTPLYKWRIPIDILKGRTTIFVYNDEYNGKFNLKTMKKYEI